MTYKFLLVETAILLLFGEMLTAQELVKWIDRWDTPPDLLGWKGKASQLSITNKEGYVDITFKAQSYPANTALLFGKTVTNAFPASLSFWMWVGEKPSALRLCLHSYRSGDMWYIPLEVPVTNMWFNVIVNVNFDNGWTTGPLRNRNQFINDMLAVDWMGFYVRRSGECREHHMFIDDVSFEGVLLSGGINLSGVIYYDGEQDGKFRIEVCPVQGGTLLWTERQMPGPYVINNLLPFAGYSVMAFRDSNSNGVKDAWEACDVLAPYMISTELQHVTNVNFTLTDPETSEGLPLWWIQRHFGLPPSGGGGGGEEIKIADYDPDDDRLSNKQEYIAGTDPSLASSVFEISAESEESENEKIFVLKWPSVAGREYTIWRTTNLMEKFTIIADEIPATPPQNIYIDCDIQSGTPYFYRVGVDKK